MFSVVDRFLIKETLDLSLSLTNPNPTPLPPLPIPGTEFVSGKNQAYFLNERYWSTTPKEVLLKKMVVDTDKNILRFPYVRYPR